MWKYTTVVTTVVYYNYDRRYMRHTLVEHTHQGTSCLTPLPVPSQPPPSCPSHPYTLPVRSNNTHQILSRTIQSIQITHLKPIRISNYTAIFISSYTLDPYGTWNGTGPFPIQPLRSPYLHTQNCRPLLLMSILSLIGSHVVPKGKRK
jgi:hypothetical protein